MAKKQMKISIDEELYNKVKSNDLNLSQLVNEYLTDFFQMEGESIHSINREIKENEEKIHELIFKNEQLSKMRKQVFPTTLEAKQQKTWQDFRIELNRLIKNRLYESDFDEILRLDAEELLGYSFVDLCMMCMLFFNRASSFDCDLNDSDKWTVIVEEYNKQNFYCPEHKDHHMKNFFGR